MSTPSLHTTLVTNHNIKVTTQFIQDLYAHSTHHPTLTQEISASPISPSSTTIDPTPVLEGFLMESMRTNSFQSTAVHRTALEPFTFSDGYTIPQGESVQFNQEKVHFDAKRYERPNEFDPCRYRNSRRAATDIGMEWPFWGVGKFAW
jgi:cytochrome P450